MTTESFSDVRRRVIAQHAAGDYAKALERAGSIAGLPGSGGPHDVLDRLPAVSARRR
jgi:hypothetical protein